MNTPNTNAPAAKTLITDFEILDCGVDHAQYFQGIGTAFTRYNHASLGCGMTAAESIEDALEAVAMEGENIDFSAIEADEMYKALSSETRDIYEILGEEPTEEESEHDERYYYTAIRYNLPGEEVEEE